MLRYLSHCDIVAQCDAVFFVDCLCVRSGWLATLMCCIYDQECAR